MKRQKIQQYWKKRHNNDDDQKKSILLRVCFCFYLLLLFGTFLLLVNYVLSFSLVSKQQQDSDMSDSIWTDWPS